jgi:carbamoylphosphate synthase large subunit
MPKRTDLKSILIIGAGPIVIGQACEFDYSGAQACKALRQEGYRVILVNSNPATIMTDPDLADATYIEPITPDVVARIIAKEKPDAVLPTMGGQTALNTAMALHRSGKLKELDVELIGANAEAIDMAEDRLLFRKAMDRIGLESPKGNLISTLDEALDVLVEVGLPAVIRPSFTLGGTGGGIAYSREDFIRIVEGGIKASPVGQVLVEESVLGWKEFEMEVVRDNADNCIIICSIENIDPMGVHTGDSITVAPALTLTDKEYQLMRNASIAVLREIGVDTGGSNVQFAVHPETGRLVVIEMNPRVSRSSALASKATGFPIAKVAAKLAVGYTLDEIINDITKVTPASFEPTIDYIVTKMPRFTFEKFPGAEQLLSTSMKSVGEAMSIGPQLPGIGAEGAALDGDRIDRLRRGRAAGLQRRDPEGADAPDAGPPDPRRRSDAPRPQRRRDPGCQQVRSLVPAPDRRHRRRRGRDQGQGPAQGSRRPAAPEEDGLFRRAPRQACRHEGEGRLCPASSAECAPGLQAHRHLRGGVRLADLIYVFLLRGHRLDRNRLGHRRVRGESERPAQGHHPRRRTQPHRPGHRVRLLLRPCRLRAARGRHRDHHGQLQSGDGVDRLRHLRPALFRAADRRGCDRAGTRRTAQWHPCSVSSSSSAARRRSSSPPRSKRPRSRSSAPRPTPSTSPKTASAFSSC